MIVDIEFLCLDMRPLKSMREWRLPSFLKPLHHNNYAIKGSSSTHVPYYRRVGALTTEDMAKRSYFQARNTIKFPDFIKHELPFKSGEDEYILRRGDTVRRHFSTDDFGVTNRLKLGFSFKFKDNNTPKDSKAAYDCLKFIMGIDDKGKGEEQKINVTTDSRGEKEEKRSIVDLGEKWMRDIILDSTRCKLFGKIRLPNKRKDVEHVNTTVVVTYKTEELPYIPKGAVDFDVPKYPEPIKMYHFAPRNAKGVRIYFIEYSGQCSKVFLNNLRKHLLNHRANYLCLEHTYQKIALNNEKQREFANNLINKITNLQDNPRYRFIDLENDEGEICDKDTRKQIEKRFRLLMSSIATIS